MGPNRVRELEDEVGQAIRAVLDRDPALAAAGRKTIHLMAKAAVTVLEAVTGNTPEHRD